MGTYKLYNLASVTKKIYDSGLNLFTIKALEDIIQAKKGSTSFSVINRLVATSVLQKIEKNKYMLNNGKINDFSLASNIYSPSYISFETVLNLYGILSQFPFGITSATTKKTNQKTVNGKTYSYTHIQRDLFWGYEKIDDYLIAMPEKALLDQIYMATKGLKGLSFDEYDYSRLNQKKFRDYAARYPQTSQLNKELENLTKYWK